MEESGIERRCNLRTADGGQLQVGGQAVWCPGCGDYSVLSSITKALAIIGKPPHQVGVVSGIGCSSRIPAYTSCYGFHGVHGRRWRRPPA